MAESGNRKNKHRKTPSSQLQFKTSTPPNLPSASNPYRGGNNSKARNQKNRKHAKAKAKHEQAQYAERKARNQLSSSFYLHSSPDHAFVISRKASIGGGSSTSSNCGSNVPSNFSLEGDRIVDWTHVRLVQILTSHSQYSRPGPEEDLSSCPICRSDFVAPRITKCGHVFCFPCILRHFQSSSVTTNKVDPHQKHNNTSLGGDCSGGKCPCCSHWIDFSELVACEFQTVHTPLSDLARMTSCTHLGGAKPGLDQVMTFTKLHRVKGCPAPFRPYLDQTAALGSVSREEGVMESHHLQSRRIHRRCGPHALPDQTSPDAPFSRFKYLHTPSMLQHYKSEKASLEQELKDLVALYQAHNASRSLFEKDKFYIEMALQAIRTDYELAKAMEGEEEALMRERDEAERINWVCLPDKKELKSESTFELHPIPIKKVSSSDADIGTKDGDETQLLESMLTIVDNENESMLDTPDRKATGKRRQQKKKSNRKPNRKHSFSLNPGVMYTDDECVQFYQSTDGQLCFISGFNLNCLSHDFGMRDPNLAQIIPQAGNTRKKPPYPDVITGRVIDTERIHLSQDVRKRMPVFSHLPLYTDILFCELDISLSPEAYAVCKGDLERRRKKRQTRRAAERSSDRKIRQKENTRFQRAKEDFDMNLFPELTTHATASASFLSDDFGPGLGSAGTEGHERINNDILRPSSSNAVTQGDSQPLNFSSALKINKTPFRSLETNDDEAFPSLMDSMH